MPRNGDSARRRRTPRISRARRTDNKTTIFSAPEILEPRKVFTGDSIIAGIDMRSLQLNEDPHWLRDLPAVRSAVVPPSTIAPAISPISIGILPDDHFVDGEEPIGISNLRDVETPIVSILPSLAPPVALSNLIATTGGLLTLSTPPLQSVAEDPVEASPSNDAPTPPLPWTGASSETQTQVEGVDEADLVETDGTLLYTLSRDGVLSILDTSAAGEGSLLYQIDLQVNQQHGEVVGMYLHDNTLTIITSSQLSIYADGNVGPCTLATVLNVEDSIDPTIMQAHQIDGAFVDSRMVDGQLMLVTRAAPNADAVGNHGHLGLNDASVTATAINVTGNANAPIKNVNFSATGNLEVFASEDNLYVFSCENGVTMIHKVPLRNPESEGNLRVAALGSVNGTLLNQFAVDEHDGHLRLVVEMAGGGSAVVVLKQQGNDFEEVGRLDGLGLSSFGVGYEDLYSVRFVEDRVYLITFLQIDPLHVVDLSDPTAPTLLGELWLPGFSDHIEFLDENHLLTIGYAGDWAGNMGNLQISIFDVSAPKNPRLLHQRSIAGTSTAITGERSIRGDGDHLALGFFPELGIITVPTQTEFGAWFHPDENQQLEVLFIDAEKGIDHLGTIDHETEITRAVQIGGKLVVTSSQKVTTHDPRNPEVVVATTELDNQSIPSLGELPVEPPVEPVDPVDPPARIPRNPTVPPARRDALTQEAFVETTAANSEGQNLEGPGSSDQSLLDAEETLQLDALAAVYASVALLTPQGSSNAPEANPVTTESRISDQTERTHSDTSTEPDDLAVNQETRSLLLSLASDLTSQSDASEDDELFSQPRDFIFAAFGS